MQDLILLLATIGFLAFGTVVPFVMSLGYVWVDIFGPHQISASLLANQPVAFIMGAAALAVYLIKDRRAPPKFGPVAIVQLMLCVWITLTNTWALSPSADFRYDLSIKVALFATFLPYVIRTRVQIEALLIVYLFSIVAHTIPWGLKTLLSGGGYNMSLGLATNSTMLLQESSTVSGVCVMVIPLFLSLRKHSILLPPGKLRDLGLLGLVLLGPVAAIGTFARTALIAFGVGGTMMWLRSKRKIASLLLAAVMAAMAYGVTSDKWSERITTINDYQNESSAFVRILVWQWGLNFVQSHPFGGGFWVWTTNRIELPGPPGQPPVVQTGRAFHNVFVALLAEQGYIGFGLYVAMLAGAILALQRTQKLTRDQPEHAWCSDLARGLQISILTIYSAGMFVEIGWTPLVWYLVSMAVCLREYARRVAVPKPATGLDQRPGFDAMPRPAPNAGPAVGGIPAAAAFGPRAANPPFGPAPMRRTSIPRL